MRTQEELSTLIRNVAETDDRIRAVLLTGSRADPGVTKDRFQDFDIIYIVNDFASFVKDHSWIDVFGERIILQLPEEMVFGEKDKNSFHYLMLFKDRNRIDLALFPLDRLNEFHPGSMTQVLLDKDNLFAQLPATNDLDYRIQRPGQKEYSDCCNEFWWMTTYVAKGLWRKEITYAKEMIDGPVRTMFMKMIEWHIGVKTEFTVSFGTAGRHMQCHIPPELYDKILSTYADSNAENIWNSLFLMTELFTEFSKTVANSMWFDNNEKDAKHVTAYLERVHMESTKS